MNRREALPTTIDQDAPPAGQPAAEPGSAGRDIVFRRWDSPQRWAEGNGSGVFAGTGGLTLATATATASHTDPVTGLTADYETATWTGPAIAAGFAATEVIPSWTADTPGGSFVRVELSGTTAAGTTTTWFRLGDWAADDTAFRRTSVRGQADDDGTVHADTYTAADGRALTSWRLRATLLRPVGSTDTPVLRTLGAVASALPAPGSLAPSVPLAAQGLVLDVPPYSQQLHRGEHPQWDNGGEAWCSPASTSMVLAYWGAGPAPADYAWVAPGHADPWVDFAARHTYDLAFSGCGNWPFNTAYAGRFGLRAFVTRLRSLNEAERFIAAGIPLIASASYRKGQIPGLDYDTRGHLVALVGFTADGDPVLNDPNSPDNAAVRKTVGRAAWEAAWLDSSRGVVYVIHPASVPLPAPPGQANW
ncbi:C39 family peptidase [Catellatospora methionotrophica]|uniref:C39 family peptidase n=1 Tax=Catellatospora methionotrophica TaxID=121620 RepID=UPI00340CF2ED